MATGTRRPVARTNSQVSQQSALLAAMVGINGNVWSSFLCNNRWLIGTQDDAVELCQAQHLLHHRGAPRNGAIHFALHYYK
jgi:hypothetical protein